MVEGPALRTQPEALLTLTNLPLWKRSGLPAESHTPSSKQPCGSLHVSARRAREGKERLVRSDCHEEEALRHVFPRYCRDKEWKVEVLCISVDADGSLSCEML
jgi:hypothetical protein